MFLTTLSVKHLEKNHWVLRQPLVWEGERQLFIMRGGFETDFASIPIVLRWLLDNAGANSEAAVLHDAVWRESQRSGDAMVDPADADGIFRRALRETGATALTRGLMWFGVRTVAIVRGRYGTAGPRRIVKFGQLVGMLLLGLLTAGLPTLVAGLGLIIYWIANWAVAVIWQIFERRRFPGFTPNWPWPVRKERPRPEAPRQDYLDKPPPRRYFDVVDATTTHATKLIELARQRSTEGHELTDDDVNAILETA